jgi:hypothetical protein
MPDTLQSPDSQKLLQIDYLPSAMESIRVGACEGLMALPRIGMGVGGLLLGVRQKETVTLTGSIDIPCSHSNGPSFNLTDAEKQKTRELIADARDRGVVGWYCSKTRGTMELGDADIALDRELFSAQDAVVLLIRPSTVQPTRAAFFFRDAKGALVKARECDIDQWHEPEKSEKAADGSLVKAAAPVRKPEPEPVREPVRAPATEPAPARVPAPPVALRADVPPVDLPRVDLPRVDLPREDLPRVDAAPRSDVPQREMFALVGAPPRSRRFNSILGGAAMVVLGATAFFTQNAWLPRPALALTSTESNGTLKIRWNAGALRGIDHASLLVNDGGNLQILPLDRFELNQGLLVYTPKSQRVTTKLSAGEVSGIAVWLAPAPSPQETLPADDNPGGSAKNPSGSARKK